MTDASRFLIGLRLPWRHPPGCDLVTCRWTYPSLPPAHCSTSGRRHADTDNGGRMASADHASRRVSAATGVEAVHRR